uniref:PX domain-containing protein n=1 Tax=Arion vulgaris TaxID=1028688 RepID=A0A0B6ZWY8_9EUPU
MVLRVSIPSFRKVKDEDDSYTVFMVDVWFKGQHMKIEKRYSEFEDLHKQLKKIMKTPEFPPKKVLKWNTKILEQRRLGLHAYFQGIVDQDPPPHALLLFLETDVLDHSMDFKVEQQQQSHQTVIALHENAYLQENKTDSLPDIVNDGVIQALYPSGLQFDR